MTLVSVAALAFGLVAFSLVSLVAVDRTLHTSLDARLATSARLFAATANGKRIDPALAQRLLAILGVGQDGALILADGTVKVQSGRIPGSILAAARRLDPGSPFARTLVNGSAVRLIAIPVSLSGRRAASALLWRPLDVVEDYEHDAALIFGLSSLLILAVTGLLCRRLIRRALQPLRAMAAGASEIEAHDLSRRLSHESWDTELRDFAAPFDRMLDRLEDAFRRQRQFTADASHDLRAPLSVMRAEVDIARSRTREPSADNGSFVSLADEINDLDRMIDALLLAARADGDLVLLQPVDLSSAVRGVLKRIAVYASAHDVRLQEDAEPAMVLAEAETLDRILLSLLHNAVKFSPSGGKVRIETRYRGAVVAVSIRDEGPGFSENALRFAFDRFWREDPARSRSGTGLGLAIAKASVERLGGTIAIANVPAGGAVVSILLGAAVPSPQRVALR